MALFEDMFKGSGASGLAVGLGVVMLGPVLLPAMARMARPAAKAVVKTGISLYRQTMSGVAEATSGLMEEARSELAMEGAGAPAAGVAAAREASAGDEGEEGNGRSTRSRHRRPSHE